MTLAACIRPQDPIVTSQDCLAAVPAGYTRIYIGAPAKGGQQSGTSFDDPLDGTTADKFDAILRSVSEGEHPTLGSQSNIAPTNLIVCMDSGTFLTNGQYDWRFGIGHVAGIPRGFTVEQGWKIHGRGPSHTRLQLASYFPFQFVDPAGPTISGGRNVVIGTHSKHASGVEISDLTVDANHDRLTSAGGVPLNLENITLRSTQGGHWVHDVNAVGGSGDVGFLDEVFETFAVRIWGNGPQIDPSQNTGSIVEHVNVTNPGHAVVDGSPNGGAMDGIVVNNAVAEIRNNLVDGFQLGYGGWSMGAVSFHDNIAQNVQYGFNVDSFSNVGLIVQNNQFIKPSLYGIVIGGSGPTATFGNWTVTGNTIELARPGSIAMVLRGQVQHSVFSNNTFTASGPSNLTAIWSYQAVSGVVNLNNTFQNNRIDRSMAMILSQDPNFNTNCRFQNRDLQGQALPSFPDNSSVACH